MRAAAIATAAGSEPLLARLRPLMLAMDYEAFARCICHLLDALGYQDAHPAGRTERKGYNRPGGGGWDVEATLPGGLVPRRVIAQIKQYDDLTVHQRSVDELRGACLRAGAAEALLVTTSAFSEVVRKAAAAPDPAGGLVAPVRLIGGEELLALMICHRIGVRQRGFCRRRRLPSNSSEAGRLEIDGLEIDELEIDEAYFRSLVGPVAAMAFPRSRPTPSQWRVTVQIFSYPFFSQPFPPFPPLRGAGPGGKTEGRGKTEGGR